MVPDPHTKSTMDAHGSTSSMPANSGIDDRLALANGGAASVSKATLGGSRTVFGGSKEGSATDQASNVSDFICIPRRSRTPEKCVFVVCTVTLVVMSCSLLSLHWLLPYYYAVSTPLLMVLRVVLYWRTKMQYFMLDFCYFGNALCYVYIWAAPGHPEVFVVLFAIANGPMAWATALFRNSLVLHSLDKMTSVYIHILPVFLMFCIRWYPESTSQYWHKPFVSHTDESLTYMAVWLFAVGLVCFVLHSMIYILVVYVLLRPSHEYLNSYRYLSAKAGDDTILGKMANVFGQKLRFMMYIVFNWSYCFLSLITVIFCYKYFAFHIVYIGLLLLIVIWNGASFYMDVFAIKGFRSGDQ